MFRGPGSRPVGERRHRGKGQPPLTGRARSRPARPGRDPATTRSAPMPGRADLADTLRPLSGPRCVSLLTADSRTRTRGPGLADPIPGGTGTAAGVPARGQCRTLVAGCMHATSHQVGFTARLA